jgi:hypothetical protein
MRAPLCIVLLFAQTSAVSAQISCAPPLKPMLDVELLLGRGNAGDARWKQFLAREVTPRFPDGLTVYETIGQWRDPARNVIVRERSRVLRMIVPADAPRDRIEAVAKVYKKQFRQDAVAVVMRPACVSF